MFADDDFQGKPLAPHVSVIIPVKDGMPLLKQVLEAVLAQQTDFDFEVIAIDSGSTDGSLECLESYGERVRVLKIAPEDFGHGKTRNLGVENSRAEFCAFLTHDAIPDDDDWLANLIKPFEDDKTVWGVFGRHVAHAGATAFTIMDMRRHFDAMSAVTVARLDDLPRFASDMSYRQRLHFYSDNNSCMRRSVWEQTPYSEIEFGEDQAWAWEVLLKRGAIAYAQDAVVRHSHEYAPAETRKRAAQESLFFAKTFGYQLGCKGWMAVKTSAVATVKDLRAISAASLPKPGLAAQIERFRNHYATRLGHLDGRLQAQITDADWPDTDPLPVAASAAKPKLRLPRPRRHHVAQFFRTKENTVNITRWVIGKALKGRKSPGAFKRNRKLLNASSGFGIELRPDDFPEVAINWIVPDMGRSSGGHITIFRMISMLQTRGYNQHHIVVCEPHRWKSEGEAVAFIQDAYGLSGVTVGLGDDACRPAVFTIATGWQTAQICKGYQDTLERCYFVQDYEPWFFAKGDEYHLAEQTYDFGLKGITAGTWLAEKLATEHAMTTRAFGFSVDHDIYGKHTRIERVRPTIFFYARPSTARRCFDIGVLAIERAVRQLKQMGVDVDVVMAGADLGGLRLPFAYRDAGVLDAKGLAEVHTQSDVALLLSATNLSLLPMEVAACGCPIVMNDGAHAQWLLADDEVHYAHMTPVSLAEGLVKVLSDEAYATSLASKAKRRVDNSSWSAEGDKVAAILQEYMPEGVRLSRARD
ncbi:MAG: glycosyltransferase [Pseudomonadota bacterium]